MSIQRPSVYAEIFTILYVIEISCKEATHPLTPSVSVLNSCGVYFVCFRHHKHHKCINSYFYLRRKISRATLIWLIFLTFFHSLMLPCQNLTPSPVSIVLDQSFLSCSLLCILCCASAEDGLPYCQLSALEGCQCNWCMHQHCCEDSESRVCLWTFFSNFVISSYLKSA